MLFVPHKRMLMVKRAVLAHFWIETYLCMTLFVADARDLEFLSDFTHILPY